MEAEARPPDSLLIRALVKSGHRFSFFRAVHLLELCHPDAVPIGTGGPARDEVVRLRPDPSFVVPRSTIARIDEVRDGDASTRRFLITQNLMGLYGIRSPIPEVYGEEILQRTLERDPVRDFLDLFHHRVLSLLYRSWARSRAHVTFRPAAIDALTRIVFSMAGLGEETVRQAAGMAPLGLLRYTVFLSRPAKTAEGLEGVLSDSLEGARVRVEPYRLRTVAVPEDQRVRLGVACCRLGEDFTLGERIADRAGRFRLHVGPLERRPFLALAPGGAARATVGALLRLCLLDDLEHDTVLGILAHAKPAFNLEGREDGPSLGIDTWLHTDAPEDSWIPFPGFPPRAAAPEESVA